MARKSTTIIRQALKKALQRIGWFSTNYLIPFLEECLQFASAILDTILKSLEKQDHGYHAAFVNSDQLLSKSNQGFCVDGDRKLSEEHSHRNMMVCAATGMGKTSCICVPFICSTNASLLINDPSGELLKICGLELQRQGVEIKVVDLANPSRSSGFNLLDYCHSHSDIQKIAGMLVRSKLGSSSNDPFWHIQAESVVSMAMKIACAQAPKYRTMGNVFHIVRSLSTNTKLVDKLVVVSGNPEILEAYKAFISMDIKLQTSIQATSLAALQIFNDPSVAKVTSASTIDLSTLRKKRVAIFIQSNTTDMKYYSSLISIFFEIFVKNLMSELPTSKSKSVYIVLDETSSLYLPSLSITLANGRKYRSGILLVLQSYEQLQDIYGKQDAESMRTNTFGRLYMGGASHTTSVEVSQMLGKYSWEDSERRKSGVRELMTPQDVRQIPTDKAVLICSNYPPMLLDLRPYYKNPFLRLKTNTPFGNLPGELPVGEIPLSSL